ncbi:MAG: hypothetical protein NT072_06115, partial [Deltaproteobacteria bacterium]|nr:hypothetical protein [Deltaproteobacteria bacterium]
MGARTKLFRNGMIIDGTGKPAFRGHVLVEGGLIRNVLRTDEALPPADEVLDVSPYAVAPGFIDMHSHCDWLLPSKEHAGLMQRLPEQGVTTIVGGNCGFSVAPITAASAQVIQESPLRTIIDLPLDYAWRSMAELFEYVQRAAPIVNLAELAGHSTVRLASTDTLRGPLKQDELQRCLDTLRQSLDEGACGVSFGLGYDPGMYAPLDEIAAFSGVAAKAGKPAFRGHVLVEGGLIRDVLRTDEALPPADEIFDVSQYAVAPGFIDMHSHCDWLLPSREHPGLMQ